MEFDLLSLVFMITQAVTAVIAIVWLLLHGRRQSDQSKVSQLQEALAAKEAELACLLSNQEKSRQEACRRASLQPQAPSQPLPKRSAVPDVPDGGKDKKIGEILLEHHFIVKDILDRALEHQVQHGGTITQYLLAYGYIDESQLAKCLCSQFKIPYLPLSSCDIPERVIKLLPVDIAEKYLAIPVDQAGDSLMVVMADPLDPKALATIKKVTGCTLKPFVGILSEIVGALETYYHVNIRGAASSKSAYPFVVESPNFRGIERREAIRFKCEMDVQVPIKGIYQSQKTKDISRDGFCFESDCAPPMGSILTMEVYLPKEFSSLPIRALVQVVRILERGEHRYEIGVKTVEIAKHDLAAIINYASSKMLGEKKG